VILPYRRISREYDAKKCFVNISSKTIGDFGKEILNGFFSKAELTQAPHHKRANLNLMGKLEAS
jgi:hypothetical protein